MRTRTNAAVVFVVSWLVVGCSSTPQPQSANVARPVVELARWQVRNGETLLGHVVQLEIRDPSGPVPFYRIQDLQGRWLGYATKNGRFSRRVPFQDGEEDLGVWSLERGTALLFEASAPVTLTPVVVDAAAPR